MQNQILLKMSFPYTHDAFAYAVYLILKICRIKQCRLTAVPVCYACSTSSEVPWNKLQFRRTHFMHSWTNKNKNNFTQIYISFLNKRTHTKQLVNSNSLEYQTKQIAMDLDNRHLCERGNAVYFSEGNMHTVSLASFVIQHSFKITSFDSDNFPLTK